jgi:hypothetical protein
MANEWPTGIGQVDAETLAVTISGLLDRLRGQTTSFRAAVASGSINSLVIQEYYSTLAEARAYVEANKLVPGLQEALRRRFASFPAFDPALSWPPMQTAIVNIATWLQANVEKSAGGRPTYQEYQPVTGHLVAYNVAISGGTRTTLLGLLDALLARFV